MSHADGFGRRRSESSLGHLSGGLTPTAMLHRTGPLRGPVGRMRGVTAGGQNTLAVADDRWELTTTSIWPSRGGAAKRGAATCRPRRGRHQRRWQRLLALAEFIAIGAFALGTFGLGFTVGGLIFGRWRAARQQASRARRRAINPRKEGAIRQRNYRERGHGGDVSITASSKPRSSSRRNRATTKLARAPRRPHSGPLRHIGYARRDLAELPSSSTRTPGEGGECSRPCRSSPDPAILHARHVHGGPSREGRPCDGSRCCDRNREQSDQTRKAGGARGPNSGLCSSVRAPANGQSPLELQTR